MYSVYTNDRLFAVVDFMEGIEGSQFEILQYKEVKKSGAPLQQIRIVLNEGEARSAAGVLQFFKGNISMKTKPGEGGAASEILRKAVTGILAKESLVKQPLMLPVYSGEGEIYLKPSFQHYLLIWMEQEEIVVDEKVFLACDTTIRVSPVRIKLPEAGDKENPVLLEMKLSGTGACVLELPVPPQEVMRLPINNEKMQLEGSYALLRKGAVQHSVTGPNRDSLTHHFSGTGEVWIAPTKGAG
jgi:uncharacterized protein (AIM24 family)